MKNLRLRSQSTLLAMPAVSFGVSIRVSVRKTESRTPLSTFLTMLMFPLVLVITANALLEIPVAGLCAHSVSGERGGARGAVPPTFFLGGGERLSSSVLLENTDLC